MSGNRIDYNFEQKNQWRNWAWNRISEHFKNDVSNKIVIYLVGTDDLDRQVAIKKGFNDYNLIGIDLDEDNIKNLRKKGGIGIKEDLLRVLWSFNNTDFKIDVVMADLCCGYTKYLDELFDTFMISNCFNKLKTKANTHRNGVVGPIIPGTFPSVFCVNMMRGRDCFSNKYRDVIEDLTDSKNRAEQAIVFNQMLFLEHIPEWDEDFKLTRKQKIEFKINKGFFDGLFDPKFKSYKSNCGNIIMDSVIFRSLPNVIFKDKNYKDVSLNDKLEEKTKVKIEKTKRKVSAAMAIRTMKMNRQRLAA